MISSLSWIPKGAAKTVPEQAEPPSREEIEELINNGALDASENSDNEQDDEEMDAKSSKQADDETTQALGAAVALGKPSKGTDFDAITNGIMELDMEHYDDEDEDGVELFSKGLGDLYYPSNEVDPYLKDKDDDDSEDLEDLIINPTDAVIVCARNEDDVSHLEVLVYEESDDGPNMYVHHEIVLSAFPLCTAWLDCPLKAGGESGDSKGNFIAVGSMEPAIEIWDLDVLDEVQPCLVLGGIAEEKKKKKKKKGKSSIKYLEGSHTDSVLGLAWNKEFRNVLASASADKLVKLWDLSTGQCIDTMEHHTDKVQSVAWNHYRPNVLLSGSFDHSVVMRDVKIPTHLGLKWSVTADVESLAWDPHSEHSFVVSLEDGTIQGFDIRVATTNPSSQPKPSFTLHAHDKAVCTIAYNPVAPNLLATGSTDKMVKLWDLSDNKPSCAASTNPKAGAVFSISFSEDSPFLLGIGGSKGKLEVWDTLSDAAVSRKFGKYSKVNKLKSASS